VIVDPFAGGTRLVDRPDDKQRMTLRRDTDATTAMTRGMAEYLGRLTFDGKAGKRLQWARVFDAWADTETVAEVPSLIVYAPQEGVYDARNMASGINARDRVDSPDRPGPGTFAVASSELVQVIHIEVWTAEAEDRVGAVAMIEDALSPVDYMHGARLELPHYHNVRASFEMISVQYDDNAESVQRRFRLVTIKVNGSVPVVRLVRAPVMTSARIAATSEIGPDVDTESE
jgi:hypothetical protein